jgi:deoxynucleoside triphosphate triphosphohydrolase SAMHD1
MKAATEGGYFDDKPLLAQPIDPESAAVRKIAEKLGTFDGHRSWRVRGETVASFIDQFPPRFREEMLKALSDAVFFDRTELTQSVLQIISQLRSSNMDIVALSANSGQIVRYIIEQEAKGRSRYAHLCFRTSLTQALHADSENLLVLVDDNISSATQARAQFLRWADVPRDKWPDECRDEDGIMDEALAPIELERLQKCTIVIVCCAGRPLAEANLCPVLEGLGFQAFVGVRWKHSVEHVVDWSPELREYLADVGLSLMAWARYRKDPSELGHEEIAYCQARAFGYGNAGSLVATASNVPTATVTAIWSPGIHKGSPWMPLMIRRNKLRHLVLG